MRATRTPLVLFVLALLLTAVMLPAQAPVPIKIFRGGVTIDWNKDPVILELNKRLGVKIEFITAAWSEVGQKVSLIMSAQDEIDVVNHLGDLKWITEEAIVPLDPYVNKLKHPYLYKLLNSTTFNPKKYEGKSYYIPMIAHGPDMALTVRGDWMKKLGLKPPKDELEFKAMLKAFKSLDPSGQTIGYQLEGAGQIRRTTVPIMSAFGIPTSPWDQIVNFDVKNGKLTHITQMPNMKAALQYLNGLYAEALVNTDFPTMDSYPKLMEKWFYAGKSGAGWIQNPYGIEANVQKNVPGSYIEVLPQFSARGYAYTRATGLIVNGYTGTAATSKNPQKAVDVVEYLNSEDGRMLFNAGIKGVHYTSFSADGYFDRIDSQWKADYGTGLDYPLYFYVGQGLVHGYIPAAKYATFEEAIAHIQMYDPASQRDAKLQHHLLIPLGSSWVGAPNPFQFVDFPDLVDVRTDLGNKIWEGWTKCIAAGPGKFEGEYSAWQADLKKLGMEKWTAAFQQYYDRNLK